ncbi:DeoR/GlpR family DNA-binding transcription regulator [Actinomyces wuliandei]|uniref:DeoR/GlpR family DNA-binding transcription regulator n=1 Tax=Actinomyces wuliandei TaxID=2057743 RepID=UPI0019D4DE69|nr:DeoR/GlpR family DNA-binding transcription regulator [Actinomyces wuliandei]
MQPDPPGSPWDRRLAVAETVFARGNVSVEELAALTGVSTMTIYRDLAALEDSGMVQRHRGRVVALASSLHEADADFRLQQNTRAKQSIASAAAALVPHGSSLMMDDSTSGIWLLRAVADLSSMTVVTNSLLVANEIASARSATLVVAGGEYQPWAHATMGQYVTEQIASMHADFCFLSASGIAGLSCYHPYQAFAEVKRAMMRSAHTSVLLLDHTKMSRRALFKFADLTDFDHVVVDSDFDPGLVARLREAEVSLVVADPPG